MLKGEDAQDKLKRHCNCSCLDGEEKSPRREASYMKGQISVAIDMDMMKKPRPKAED